MAATRTKLGVNGKSLPDGIFRQGDHYAVSYRINGRLRWEYARTEDDAVRAKAKHTIEARQAKAHAKGHHRGDPQDDCPDCQQEIKTRDRAAPTLREYLIGDPDNGVKGWIDRYRGTGRRGYRIETRDEDRRLLQKFALQYFPGDLRLNDLKPGGHPSEHDHIAGFIGWLCDRDLADNTVRNALKPLRSALATARREGLISHNPTLEAELPHREEIIEDEDKPRPFPRVDEDGETIETMELVVSLINPKYRLMFELLAATGIRRSELLAIRVQDLSLNRDRPHVHVRQRLRRQKGNGLVAGPLKSKHARRELPIPLDLADRLRAQVRGREERELVFPSRAGTP